MSIKWVKKYQNKFCILVTIVLGTLINWHDYRTEDTNIRSQLLEHANILSGAVNIERIQTLTGTEADLNSLNYKRLKEQLSSTLAKTTGIRFIYLMGKKENGDLFFFVDSEKETSKDYSPPGQLYDDASDIDKELFTSRKEAVQGPENDTWGTWVTASSAIKDSTGKTIAVLGFDVEASNWMWKVLSHCWAAWGINCFVTLILLIYFFYSAKQKKIEEELHNAQAQVFKATKLAALGTMASGIAHELNNPLAIIMGFNNMLKPSSKPEQIQTCTEKINNAAQRMILIVNRIRDFSYTSIKDERMLISPNKIIENSLILLETSVKQHQITLNRNLNEYIPDFWVNDNKMESVIQSLLTNAKESFDEGCVKKEKIIKISSSRATDAENIIIQVEDTGKGIPKHNLDKIFDPFFTTKINGTGTGLGLSTTYNIIKEHGGEIVVKSTVGVGTVVTVSIPIDLRANRKIKKAA